MGLALRHRPPGLRAFAYAFIYFVEAMLLARALRRAGAERLHVHFANPAAIVGMLSARYLGLPFSLTLHGISEFDYPAGLLLREKVEAADVVICASWFVRAQAMRLVAPLHWRKFHVVRCGLDLSSFPAPARRTQPSGPRALICVGRLSAEKGQAGLLEAITALPDLDIRLTLLGDGPMRAALEDEVKRLGLATRVLFLGPQSEEATKAAIADSELLVLPSFMEGLPVVLMEAMALGVPVIAPHVAGIPELIEEGVEGLLFRPSDWTDLADKIRLALTDGERIQAMIPWARAKVEREFDVEQSASTLSALFDRDPKEDESGQRGRLSGGGP